MEPKPFDNPVTLQIDGRQTVVHGAGEAALVLADVNWPGPRDDLHADALDACLKVLDGHRSSQDGRQRLVEAALAAGIYATHDVR